MCSAPLVRSPATLTGGDSLQKLVGFLRRCRLGELAENVVQPSACDRKLFVTDEETGEVQFAFGRFFLIFRFALNLPLFLFHPIR